MGSTYENRDENKDRDMLPRRSRIQGAVDTLVMFALLFVGIRFEDTIRSWFISGKASISEGPGNNFLWRDSAFDWLVDHEVSDLTALLLAVMFGNFLFLILFLLSCWLLIKIFKILRKLTHAVKVHD